ncbi:MAG: Gfo/Idh/MocA family oxidoreductase [Treponema sp.]|jgi:predicted dehydrogenase|nr:Gfo/Idh/MocA family oxidoreductase [Treponema sp.]
MLQVGIMSSWHVHAKDYVRELQESGKVQPAALWDENPEQGRARAAEWGAAFEADYDAFLNRKDFTAVICNAPTTMHRELLVKAAKAGKDIFTEKLLAPDMESAEAIAAEIRRAGVIFTISLPLRSNPAILYVKRLVEEGTLGRVTGGRFRRSHNGVSDHWLPEYWFDPALTGGGAMMDLGAHPVYVLSLLFGPPKRITGMVTNPFGTNSDENAIGIAEFRDGILGTMETGFVTFGVPDLLEVYGTEGSVFMRGSQIELTTKALCALGVSSGHPQNLPEAKPSPLMQFVEACINRTGSPEGLGLEDALIMTKIIETIYQTDKN